MRIPLGDLRGWLATTPADDAVVAVARLVALVLAWWLLASSSAYAVASLLRMHGVVRRLGWATLPGVRRLVDAMVAGSVVVAATMAATPAGAVTDVSTPDHAYVPRPAGDGPAPPTTTSTTTTATTSIAPMTTSTALPVVVPAPRAVRAAAPAVVTVLVHPGDSLWRIAERQVAAGGLGRHDVRTVAAYWRRLVEANRHRLVSGDPDLIYPGEVVVLP
ncbi:MAG TPA: LysM peptidoglycan-binding domain-containing protein [Acidimicrobiales bacterium]|nr:LysM peptidoglycan-binding domain-containing protein [Acidimicrobiales bacterium]